MFVKKLRLTNISEVEDYIYTVDSMNIAHHYLLPHSDALVLYKI